MIRILIADDHPIVRLGLRHALESPNRRVVVAEARNGSEAVELAATHQPDVIVMDSMMPLLDGLSALRRIRDLAPDSDVIVYTINDSETLLREFIDAGVMGYVLKSETANLIPAVEAVADHRTYYSPWAQRVMLDALGNYRMDRWPDLTGREREVVKLVADGLSSKEVASHLGISLKTVETHRSSAMSKLQVNGTAELVRYAVRNRLVEP